MKNITLRDSILLALVSAVIGIVSFLITDHITNVDKNNEFILEIQKKLYDDEANAFEKFDNAYSNIINQYNHEFGISTFDETVQYGALQKSLEDYQKFLKELDRYGNANEIKAAKRISDSLMSLYSDFFTQHLMADGIERRTKELLASPNNSPQYQFLSKDLDVELDRFVNLETMVYFSAKDNKKPLIDSYHKYLNYQFRKTIGLEEAENESDIISKTTALEEQRNKAIFRDRSYPFIFASQRGIFTSKTSIPTSDKILERKNSFLKEMVKLRFIHEVALKQK